MKGVEGKYISVHENDYQINTEFDPSLRVFAQRFLPLVSCFFVVSNFLSTYNEHKYGLVNHALCEGLNVLFKEYMVLLLQLETSFRSDSSFTLQKLWFFLQKPFETMKECANMCLVISNDSKMGGETLNILSQLYTQKSGSPELKKLYTFVLSKAIQPFILILREWIHCGELKDPYKEFFVFQTDKEWDSFVIRREHVPPFLQQYVQKILVTGKYLKVYKQYGKLERKKWKEQSAQELVVHGTGNYISEIQECFLFSNMVLLNLFFEKNFMGQLASLKYLFLLHSSDFLDFFLELANSELEKPRNQCNVSKLQSFLDIALKTNFEVKVKLSKTKLFKFLLDVCNLTKSEPEEILAIDAFHFKVHVDFPLSIVFHAKCLKKYQMFFRSLLLLKYTEKKLNLSWKSGEQRFSLLRMKMLSFVRSIAQYFTQDVIESNHVILVNFCQNATKVDEICTKVMEFQATCLKKMFMADAKILPIYSRMMQNINLTLDSCFNDFFDSKLYKIESEWNNDMRDFILLLRNLDHLNLLERLDAKFYI